MLEGFDYRMAKWLPYQDLEACRRVRAIKRDAITKHPNPDFKIEVLPDDEFPFRIVTEIFLTIKEAMDAGRRLVLITPQPEPLYARVAYLINRFRVNCANLYTFNMDEYADEDGNIAPETWPNSFLYAMKRNFYATLDPVLRPPEGQITGPTNDNIHTYGKMIADLGGADVCFGGIGWSGHLAFIEPGSEAYPPIALEDWKKLGPKIVELTPMTVLQGVLGPEFGGSGDWSWYPPKAATIGPAEIVGAKLRSSWNGFRIGSSMISWQRFTVRLAAHGPVTPLLPASLLQTLRSDMYLTESIAADIVAAEDYSWYG
jgi:glucosamine-6-phosphate deaminase